MLFVRRLLRAFSLVVPSFWSIGTLLLFGMALAMCINSIVIVRLLPT